MATYIATEKVTEATVSNEEFELFKEVEATKLDDTKVMVKQTVGSFSVARLQRDKVQMQEEITMVQARISEIDAKLAAIENASTPVVVEK